MNVFIDKVGKKCGCAFLSFKYICQELALEGLTTLGYLMNPRNKLWRYINRIWDDPIFELRKKY